MKNLKEHLKNRNTFIYEYDSPVFKRGNSKTIFTVCAMENLSPKHGQLRTFGWYSDMDGALEAVKNNDGEIHECRYDYAVIEEVKEGIFAITVREFWFKWNNKKSSFISIRKPKGTMNTINWGIG